MTTTKREETPSKMSDEERIEEAARIFKSENESTLTDDQGRYLPGTPIAAFKAAIAWRDANPKEHPDSGKECSVELCDGGIFNCMKTEVEAELEELRKDKVRLEWMIKYKRQIECPDGVFSVVFKGKCYDGVTPREAIDAAMKSEGVNLKKFFREFFSPLYCERDKHRWAFSRGMSMYHCKDCFKYISIEEYRGKMSEHITNQAEALRLLKGEVLPEVYSKPSTINDAEKAAEEWCTELDLDEIYKDSSFDAHLAGQSVGEARARRQAWKNCIDFLRSSKFANKKWSPSQDLSFAAVELSDELLLEFRRRLGGSRE